MRDNEHLLNGKLYHTAEFDPSDMLNVGLTAQHEGAYDFCAKCVGPEIVHANRYQAKRAGKNDASRNDANHNHEPWTSDELDELCKNWDGTDPTLEVIAFVLGRTIEACRQRYYVHIHGETGRVREPITRTNGEVTPTFRPGWLFAQCSICGETRDVYMDHSGTKTCEDHEGVDG